MHGVARAVALAVELQLLLEGVRVVAIDDELPRFEQDFAARAAFHFVQIELVLTARHFGGKGILTHADSAQRLLVWPEYRLHVVE